MLPRSALFATSHPPHVAGDAAQRPIFILGSPRSGTSTMAAVLRNATRYNGYNEGHFFSLLSRLLKEVESFYRQSAIALENRTMIAAVPLTYVEEMLGKLFHAVARDCFGTQFWFDKTPSSEMILIAPLLVRLWPNARFVFMRRRGIENVASRLRKFPEQDFARHCHGWSEFLRMWRHVRPALAGRAIEVDLLTLLREPMRVASAMGALAGFDSAEIAAIARAVAVTHVEQTSVMAATLPALEESGWSPDQQRVFDEVCGPMMRAYGYSMGAGYHLPGMEGSGLVRL